MGIHLNKLIKVISDVKAIVEAETYGVDPNIQVVAPILVPPIMVTIQTSTLQIETGPSAFDNMVNKFSTLQLDFSRMPLSEVYEVQQEAAMEMRLRENVVAYQATKQQRKVKAHKSLLKEKEQ